MDVENYEVMYGITAERYNKYVKTCDLYLELSKREFHDYTFQLVNIPTRNNISLHISKDDLCVPAITISSYGSWGKIKQLINRSIATMDDLNDDCYICLNSFTADTGRTSCPKCRKFTCMPCYWNIFKHNDGLIVCPFCKDTIGRKMPKNIVDMIYEEKMMML